jgi:hypothetical protein
MENKPAIHPVSDSRKKDGNFIQNGKSGVDKALDEALEESFPASDPVAISIDNHKPVGKT